MAFRKTSIAINTHVLDDQDVEALANTPTFPANPELGDVFEAFAWDGGAWIPIEVWTARRAADQPPAEA